MFSYCSTSSMPNREYPRTQMHRMTDCSQRTLKPIPTNCSSVMTAAFNSEHNTRPFVCSTAEGGRVQHNTNGLYVAVLFSYHRCCGGDFASSLLLLFVWNCPVNVVSSAAMSSTAVCLCVHFVHIPHFVFSRLLLSSNRTKHTTITSQGTHGNGNWMENLPNWSNRKEN